MRPHTAHPRLTGFDYTGTHTYHITVVTAARQRALTGDLADHVVGALEDAATRTSFELLAYTVMPDHVHVLTSGTSPDANLVRFIQHF